MAVLESKFVGIITSFAGASAFFKDLRKETKDNSYYASHYRNTKLGPKTLEVFLAGRCVCLVDSAAESEQFSNFIRPAAFEFGFHKILEYPIVL